MRLPVDWGGVGAVTVPSFPAVGGSLPFQHGLVASMVVWVIPQGQFTAFGQADVAQVLADLGFTDVKVTANADGSFTASGTLTGPSFTPSIADAADTLVFSGGTFHHPGGNITSAFSVGEDIQGATSGVLAQVVSEYDDPSDGGVLTLLADLPPAPEFQVGETIHGLKSGGSAVVTYQYALVLKSPVSGAMLGVSSVLQTSPPTVAPPIHVVPTPTFPATPVKVSGPCAKGTIADSMTGKCVAPCSDGSAPAGLVCPSIPVTTPAGTISTGTYAALGAGVLGAGAAVWYFFLR